MPVLTQLNLNIGTEQNPNMVLHDLYDIRISSTDVTTVTRLLGCDAGVNSIAPLTLANAASLLGDVNGLRVANSLNSFNYDLGKFGFFVFSFTSSFSNHPTGGGRGICFHMQRSALTLDGASAVQITSLEDGERYIRSYSNSAWSNWSRI